MQTNNASTVEGIDTREAKALTEVMTVLGDLPEVPDNEQYAVITQSGSQYEVDLEAKTCTCSDFEYRNDVSRCKHLHRVCYAIGLARVPEWINEDVIDGDLGEFVPTKHEPSAADAHPGEKVATDGGAAVREAVDDAEILEDESTDPWEGPFPEYDAYGDLTGSSYVTCRGCSREILTGRKEFATHRDGCKFGDS